MFPARYTNAIDCFPGTFISTSFEIQGDLNQSARQESARNSVPHGLEEVVHLPDQHRFSTVSAPCVLAGRCDAPSRLVLLAHRAGGLRAERQRHLAGCARCRQSARGAARGRAPARRQRTRWSQSCLLRRRRPSPHQRTPCRPRRDRHAKADSRVLRGVRHLAPHDDRNEDRWVAQRAHQAHIGAPTRRGRGSSTVWCPITVRSRVTPGR